LNPSHLIFNFISILWRVQFLKIMFVFYMLLVSGCF
jgi:hypothetical protein